MGMNTKTLKLDMEMEDGTIYLADKKDYDIFLQNTKRLTDKKYLSLMKCNCGYLDVAFHLKGLKNVILDFNGAVLRLHGALQPFILENCENVTIRNVVIEYARSFHSEFEIVEKKDRILKLKQKEEFPCRVENGYLIPYSEDYEWHNLHNDCHFLQVFDSTTREGKGLPVVMIGEKTVEPESPPARIYHLRVREEENMVVLMGELPGDWASGMTAVISHATREVSSCFVICSKNIVIDNFRIINGIGMGILGMYSENLKINNLKLYYDERSHGIVSNDGDAMHIISCFGNLDITDCICEGMEDDALNIHGNYYGVKGTDRNILYAYCYDLSTCINAHYKMFGEGDEIAVYRGNSMEEKGRYIVKNVTITGDYDIRIEVERPVVGIDMNDTIENLSAQPRVTIRNCRFGKANSHLRLQTRKRIVVENCISSLPILLTGDKNYWYESSPINDLTIRNCSFTGRRGFISAMPEGFDYTLEAPYYHSGIKILDNSFETVTALTAIRTDDIVFRDNVCVKENVPLEMRLKQCGDVEADERVKIIEER